MPDHTPQFETSAETVEFEAIAEPEIPRRRETYELRLPDENDLELRLDFEGVVRIDLGRTAESSPVYLVHGAVCPQLGAEFIVVQPDVVREDPAKGWDRLPNWAGIDLSLGRDSTPWLRLGPDVTREGHLYIYMRDAGLDLVDESKNGTRVTVDVADVLLTPDGRGINQ